MADYIIFTYKKLKKITPELIFIISIFLQLYRVYYITSKSRDVGPCILTMRMAFEKFKQFPGKALKFIADGYSAYPLAAQQFMLNNGWEFDITQVMAAADFLRSTDYSETASRRLICS